MKVSKNSKYQAHKKSSETLSKNPNDRTGGPFRIFKHPLSQNIKKWGGLWGFFSKKGRTMPKKKLKGRPFSLARFCMLQRKKKNLFHLVR